MKSRFVRSKRWQVYGDLGLSDLFNLPTPTEQIELMNQKTWRGLTTTTFLTILGTITFHGNFILEAVASTVDSSTKGQISEASEKIHASRQINSLSVAANPTKEKATAEPIATIFEHQWKDASAVTLRIRDIPVLTFLESPVEAQTSDLNKTTSKATEASSNPLARAKTVASKLNRLAQNDVDARQIVASWNSADQSYSIKVKGEEIAKINDKTILPDTTNNPATDALQATNRLRRLMGGAEPLAEIAGKPKPSKTLAAPAGAKQMRGIASWYGPGFHGRQTANGERFNQNDLTAAHRSLPFGTRVKVTNMNNGRSVVVRINDRGPFAGGRVIDLSSAAANAIGLKGSGVGPVNIQILGR